MGLMSTLTLQQFLGPGLLEQDLEKKEKESLVIHLQDFIVLIQN